MVKRLSEQGLLEHVPYRGVQLTAEGRRAALRMVRRHRLIEAYLVAFLGYSWDTVHDEAERLEHAVSDTLVDRMAAVLGHPTVDPHGDPIPTPDGSIHELACTPLAEVPTGATVEIRRVDESQPDRLRYIASIGLRPGVQVTVLDRQPFQGPITIAVDGHTHVIGHDSRRCFAARWRSSRERRTPPLDVLTGWPSAHPFLRGGAAGPLHRPAAQDGRVRQRQAAPPSWPGRWQW